MGGTVYVWDLSTGKDILKLKGHMAQCTHIDSDSNNGFTVATCSEDTNVKIWDLRLKAN